MQRLRRKLRFLLDVVNLSFAWANYPIFQKVSTSSQHAFVRLFCSTSGKSNDVMAACISFFSPPKKIKNKLGVITEFTESDFKHVNDQLSSQGYYIFKERISSTMCDKLLNFAMNTPAVLRPIDGQKQEDSTLKSVKYDPINPEAICYDFNRADLINNPVIQDIVSDYSILSIAQKYLKAEPILDAVCMWWQTSFKKNPDKSAAQFYHFDLDRVKWLKFFIYLTDVSTDNGPHTFISESHISNGIPRSLLNRGYTRLTDAEVAEFYDKKSFIEFNAPRGTVIAEDTRGLHKGKNVFADHRLMLQLQFSNCLFGLNNPSYAKTRFDAIYSPSLDVKIQSNPKIFSSFL